MTGKHAPLPAAPAVAMSAIQREPILLTQQILAARRQRFSVSPWKANAVIHESEPDATGRLTPTTTLLLAAAECPLRCAMCDLWQHTLAEPTPAGAIPAQIVAALTGGTLDGGTLDGGTHSHERHQGTVKLYNSGSFFDPRSVPVADYPAVAAAVKGFDRVVVENHPRFGRSRIARFASLLEGRLEIAVGLETIQPGMLRRLNKRMNRDDFDRFARQLKQQSIDLRVFLMLRPPWTFEQEAIRWTLLSVRHAMFAGARHITIIPARAGNGWMDQQQTQGHFQPPRLSSLLDALQQSQAEARRRGMPCAITADLWDVDAEKEPATFRQLSACNQRGR